jgi:hypothetical protein
VVSRIAAKLANGQVRPVVGPTGAIAFIGITDQERDDVTDACIFRRVMATGSALAKLAIQRAEQLAGRSVNRQAVALGHHAHEHGGHLHWHDHK